MAQKSFQTNYKIVAGVEGEREIKGLSSDLQTLNRSILLISSQMKAGLRAAKQYQDNLANAAKESSNLERASSRTAAQLAKNKTSATSLLDVMKQIPASFVAAGFAGSQYVRVLQGILQTQAKIDQLNSILNIVNNGDIRQTADDLDYLRSTTDRLGINFAETALLFGKVSAAAQGTALQGAGMRDVFDSFAGTLGRLNASTDTTNRVFFALQQIISKNVVSSEELKNQLGEKIPGIMNISARAIGKTTTELQKMLENGEVLAADFLPKLAKELGATFDVDKNTRIETTAASMNRFGNAVEDLRRAVVDTGLGNQVGGALDTITEALKGLTEFTNNNKAEVLALINGLGAAATITGIYSMVKALQAARTAVVALGVASSVAGKTPLLAAILGIGSLAVGGISYLAARNEELQKSKTLVDKLADATERQAEAQAAIARMTDENGRKKSIVDQKAFEAAYKRAADAYLEIVALETQLETAQQRRADNNAKNTDDALKLSDKQREAQDKEYENIMMLFSAESEANKILEAQRKAKAEAAKKAKALAEAARKEAERQLEAEKKHRAEQIKSAKAFGEFVKQTESATKSMQDQLEEIGLTDRALTNLRAKRLLDAAAAKESAAANEKDAFAVAKLRKEAEELRKQAGLTVQIFEANEVEKMVEKNRQMAQQLEDDLINAFEKAFLEGGKFGKSLVKSIEAQFAKMVLRPVIEAVVKGQDPIKAFGTGLNNVANLGSMFGSSMVTSVGSAVTTLGGMLGSEAVTAFGSGIANTFAGAGAAGGAVGAGATVGAALPWVAGGLLAYNLIGGKLFGNDKISARGLTDQELEPIAKAVQTGFADLLQQFGGTGSLAATVVGNTGRQGQNPNFGITTDGYSSASRFAGNDLFLRGEIAMTEQAIAEEVTRAIVAGLQRTDLADNIDQLFASVDPVTASFAELNSVLEQARILDAANDLAKVDGALSTLAGASVETLQGFFEMAGGLDNLQQGFSSFYQAFYSEQEKLDKTTQQVTETFAQLGLEVPATRKALAELVDGLNLQEEADQNVLATILKLTPALDAVLPPFEALQVALEGTAAAAAQAAATANALNVQQIVGRRAYQQAQDEAYKAEIQAQQEAQQAAYDSAIAIGDFATAADLMLIKFQEIKRTTQSFLEEGFRLGLEFENRRIDSLISNPTSTPVRQFAPTGGYVGMEMQAGTRVQRELALQAQIFASTLTNVHDEVRRAQAITLASQRQIKLYFDDLSKYTEQFAQDANSLLSRLDRNIEVTQRLKVMSDVFGEAVDNFRGFMDLGFAGYSNIAQGQEVFIAEAIANATKRASSIIETNQTQIFENLVQSAVGAFDAVGYSDAIVQLSDALAKGKISIEDYNKFVGIADKQFQGIADSAQDASLSLQELDSELVNIASRAYSDLQRSVENASGDLARAQQAYSDAVIERQRELIQNQISALDEQIGELEGRRGPFESFLDSVKDFRRGLLLESGILKSENRRNLLRSEFNRTAALARSGDVDALGQVQGLASSLVSEIATNSVDPVQFAREFGALNQTVIDVQEEAQRKKDEIDNQIQALQAQQAALQAQIADNTDRVAQAQYELLIAQAEFDAQSELLAQADALIQENQLEALLGIQQTTQGVIEAISALAAAQSAIALASKTSDPVLLPAFASGGMYSGGMALVGEQGPELINFNSGGYISNARDTAMMMRGGNDMMVAEIRALRAEVAQLRADNSAENRAIATNTAKTAQVLVKVSENGDSFYTEPR